MNKQEQIKSLVEEMLTDSYEAMKKNIDKVLKSGAIDIDGWDEKDSPMRLPKCIVAAILQNEATQYEGKGTGFEKQINKEVKNIRYFI